MPTPNQNQETYSIDDFAAKIKQRRPDLAQMDNHELVSKLVTAKPEFQNFIRTEDLQRSVNPNAPTQQDSGIISSAENLGKGVLSFFGGMAKNAITPAQTPEEKTTQAAAQSTGVPGAAPLALLYKRSFFDPAQAAREDADTTRLRAVAQGQDPNAPLTVGQKANIVGNAATAAVSYLGPTGFGSPLLGEAIFTPQVAGGAASQVGQGDYAGGATTAALGIFAPKVMGKVGDAFKKDAPPEVAQVPIQPAPEASQATQGANYRPEATYVPSEKAATMSAQDVDRGPEFNAQSFQEEINRNNSILRNPQATDVDRQVATDRLRDARDGMARVQGGGTVVPQEAPVSPEVKAAPVEEQAAQKVPETASPVSPEAAQRASKFDVSTDSMGIRWATNGADKVSIPKSVGDADIDTYAGPKLDEQAAIKKNLFSEPATVDQAEGSSKTSLAEPQTFDPTKAPDTQAAQVNAEPTSEPRPLSAPPAEPQAFPLEHVNRRLRTVEDAQSTLDTQNLHPTQAKYWSEFLEKQQKGMVGDINTWLQGNPDPSLIERELDRVKTQAESIRATLESDPIAKQMRAEMGDPRWIKSVQEGAGPEGTDLRTYEKVADIGVDTRETYHKALGDPTRTVQQAVPDNGIDEATRKNAESKIQEIKDLLNQRAEELISRDPSADALDPKQRLARILKDEKLFHGRDLAGELKDLRSIAGRKASYETATRAPQYDPATGKDLGSRGTLGKGKAVLDEQGVVRPAGKVGEITLDYQNKVLGKKLNKIDKTAIEQHASNLERRAGFYDNLLKNLKQKRGPNSESGVIGEARSKSKASLENPISSTEYMRKQAMKYPELASWEISDDKPASAYGFISPDGKLWVEGADGLEHQDIARRLLKDVDYPRPEEGPVNAMLRDGWIRKASGQEYQAHRLGPRQLNAIEMSMIRDGRFGKDTIIDSMGPDGIKAIHVESGWEDLASAVDKIKRTDPAWRAQAGVGGAELMGGVSAGMIGGYAAGHAIAGPLGGIVGGSVGALVGGSLPALLRHPMVRGVLTSLSDEVKDLGYGSYQTGKQVVTDLTHFLAPRMGASEDALKTIYAMKGNIAKAGWETSKLLEVYQKHVEALPREAQIDFIDRMKTGSPQLTPELDDLAKTIKSVDQADYDAIKKYRPGLPFLENHFRLLYDTIPGVTEDGFKGFLAKRPLQGSKGMLNQHVYNTLSDAMATGGKPITTNPIDMFLTGHVDAQRFVHAQAMWETAKTLGLRDFTKLGDKPSPGMVPLDDAIAKVYFPAESGEGMVTPGQHFVTEDFGRLLNNYLSKDYIRQNVLGKTIVDAKNIATGWELFGPFHGVAISLSAMSGNLALGISRAFNLGVRDLNLTETFKGLSEVAKSPLGPRTSYLDGKNIQEFGNAINRYKNGDGKALTDFSNSNSGQKFLQHYPDAEGLLGDAFMGGLNMKMSDDVRSNITKSMMENFRNNEYLQGTVKVPFAALNSAMSPLFETVIPRIKLGMFLKDMSLQLKTKADALVSGDVTREKIARQVVDRTENVFGEMNFDNLFWNKTFKTSMQMLYRSVTWRLGTVRLLKDSLISQAKEGFSDVSQGKVPKLDANLAYLPGELLITGALGAVIMKTLSGKNPQNMTDLLHPQTGDKDSRGKPVRVNIPSYMSRDIPNILGSPSGLFKYMAGGQSALIQRALESWNNKDFSGSWVANPNDPQYKQFAAKVIHMIPGWMAMSTADRLDAEGASKDRKVLAYAGFTPAPKSVDLSAAELQAQSSLVRHIGLEAGKDPQINAKSEARNRLTAALQNHRPAGEIFRQGMKDGTLSPDDVGSIAQKITTPLVVQLSSNPKMTIEDVMGVYKVATPQEKNLLRPVIISKLSQLEKLPPERRGPVWQQVQQAFQGAHQ